MQDQSPTTGVPSAVAAQSRPQRGVGRERVLAIRHYTDKLFSFRTTRSAGLRFESGQFVMIGLEVDGRPLMRAYSMASANYDEHLDFFSIKVPDGPLTSRLQHIRPGDEVLVGSKPTGTLLLGNLAPGRRLYLLATGTGFAPFASILRDPETWERFETVVAVEGCREAAELSFATETVMDVRGHEYLGELAAGKLLYYATVTRDAYHHQGRITDLLRSGAMLGELGLPDLDASEDRVMICGNPGMLAEIKAMLAERGFEEGSSGEPGAFVIERAFVER
jgi:ferredoxin/flavodoxin---NADP+ reductase